MKQALSLSKACSHSQKVCRQSKCFQILETKATLASMLFTGVLFKTFSSEKLTTEDIKLPFYQVVVDKREEDKMASDRKALCISLSQDIGSVS